MQSYMNVDAQVDVNDGGGTFVDEFDGAWPERKRGGGGGRPSPFLDKIRALPIGGVHREDIIMTVDDKGDIERAARRTTAKVYRKEDDGSYTVGFKPMTAVVKAGTMVGGKTVTKNQVWIKRSGQVVA